MAELKTKPTNKDVREFLASVADKQKRKDAERVCALMQEVTGEEPKMWGPSIVGFGAYHYKYASGREGDWPITGFSPRKQALTLYLMDGYDNYQELLGKLGPHKTGKSCLYLKRLDDIDMDVLREMVAKSVAHVRSGALWL